MKKWNMKNQELSIFDEEKKKWTSSEEINNKNRKK